MKKKVTILFILLISGINGFSQKKNIFLTNVEFSIYCPNFEKSKDILNSFIKLNNAQIINITENTTTVTGKFNIEQQKMQLLDSLIETLGYLNSKNINTKSYEVEIEKIHNELKYLNEKKIYYDKELSTITNKDAKYYEYWDEVRVIEKRIYELETDQDSYKNDKIVEVIFTLYDDNVDYTSDSYIDWVNMPGASFEMFYVETPVSTISAEQYIGYSLKYMITKGKSHFTLGNLKKFSTEPTDSTQFTEFFHFGFGQDFYTKHFGRGKRNWFNLYTGYNAGGIFATSDVHNTILPYVKAFLGVELFKNKYILIDNKIGYFIPFKYNRNLRGLEYSFSFNFVF